MHRSLPKNFQIQKILRFDKSDTDISEMKVVRNYILSNLYLDDKLPILHYSPSGSLKSWPNSQIGLFFKSDADISNDTVQLFGRKKSCQKLRYKQL